MFAISQRFTSFLLASKPKVILLLLSVLLVMAVLASSASGSFSISWIQFISSLMSPSIAMDELSQKVLVDIRLPRVLFSSLNGAALAIAGVTMQALFRNPLAEPSLIGISSGAALGAVAGIVLAAGHFFFVSSFAFAGSVLATFIAYLVGKRFVGVSGLLLAGIAINTIAGSFLGLLIYVADDNQLRDLTFWSMGSLAGASWSVLLWLTPLSVALMVYLCRQWQLMNALLLGESEASHLGFQMKSVRWRLIVVTALLVGPLVAITGGIAFIGLVVPHLMRMLLGAHHRYLLPSSLLAGALLLTLSDWLARVIISPQELPIGLITSLIGGPFFLWLIARQRS